MNNLIFKILGIPRCTYSLHLAFFSPQTERGTESRCIRTENKVIFQSHLKHTSTVYGDTHRWKLCVCFKVDDSSFSSLSVVTTGMQLAMLPGIEPLPLAATLAHPAKAITAVCGHS